MYRKTQLVFSLTWVKKGRVLIISSMLEKVIVSSDNNVLDVNLKESEQRESELGMDF